MSDSESDDVKKRPGLRKDLKVSRQVRGDAVGYVVKDPIKGTFYRFSDDEWAIIRLFDGTATVDEMVVAYNKKHPHLEIDTGTIEDYRENLESMNLLQKSKADMNVMLVEKMKEMRQSQIFSKKGSLLYKRFPLYDPNKLFDKVIPYIPFFWTKGFLIFSLSIMAIAVWIVLSRWDQVQMGAFELFSFSDLSTANLILLWVVIYTTIAIHEFGHGLTCKRYGGEVHEIGFLMLFFQPCLYCNVNDAWLFDKKWKQVLVTIAGGYIEFFIGAICAIIWATTNPNTFINILCFQVMTVCSISTVLFNFNPLIKLDGYYLLSDYLAVPNLKENSSNYVKYLLSKYVFKVQTEDFEATRREKRIYFIYGTLSILWMTSLIIGIAIMVKTLTVRYFQEIGIFITLGVVLKLQQANLKKLWEFSKKFYQEKKDHLGDKVARRYLMGIGAIVFVFLFVPFSYSVPAKCTLEASFVRVIRADVEGVLKKFYVNDGSVVTSGTVIAQLDNDIVLSNHKIAEYDLEKVKYKVRKSMLEDVSQLPGLQQEQQEKELKLAEENRKLASLEPTYQSADQTTGLLSCDNYVRKIGQFFVEGDEICKVYGTKQLKAVVEITEQEVRFIRENDPVEFKLNANPFHTYDGFVNKIRVLSSSDPRNPTAKVYNAEILIDNPGGLKPGMSGIAKVLASPTSMVFQLGRKIATFFRIDLFY